MGQEQGLNGRISFIRANTRPRPVPHVPEIVDLRWRHRRAVEVLQMRPDLDVVGQHSFGRSQTIVERRGLRQVQDASALEAWVDEAFAENPGPVEQYRGGKEGALNALIGPVIKKSGGAANPKAVRELLLQRLSRSCSTAR